ncbi:MAG: hypothetical protein SGBAC_009850 [Bacillariaceae sp.]
MKHATGHKKIYQLLNMREMNQQQQHQQHGHQQHGHQQHQQYRGMRHYQFQVYGNRYAPAGPYGTFDWIEESIERHAKSPPELGSTPKLISEIGGLGIFEFIASYFSKRIMEDPALHVVYGEVSKEQGFLLHVGLLLFCVNDDFKVGDRYASAMAERARENPTLQEHCRLGLMKDNGFYFNRLFHHLMESLSVCRCRKSILRLVSRFSMMRSLLQAMDRTSLLTIREHEELVSEVSSDSDESLSGASSTSSSSFSPKGATNE